MVQQAIPLTQQDLEDLAQLIASLDIFRDLAGRRTLVKIAKLDETVLDVDLLGHPLYVARKLIERLIARPRAASGETPLGQLLVTLKPHLNSNLRQSEFIDAMLERYGLFPLARELPNRGPIDITIPAPPPDYPAYSQEAFRRDTMRDVSFLMRAIIAARAVVKIEILNPPSLPLMGTGFLIGPRLLVTNCHVLPERALLARTRFHLNYELRVDGVPRKSIEVQAQDRGFFVANEDLDYALVELKEDKSEEVGYLPLYPNVAVAINERINIVGHPNGSYKVISIQDNFAIGFDGHHLLYSTSTTFGSSGSPVFNDKWEVVALHQGSRGETTRRDLATGLYERVPVNLGTSVEALYAHLQTNSDIHGDPQRRKAFQRLMPAKGAQPSVLALTLAR